MQGLGVLPDSMADLGVDAMVAGGHAWLLGPEGAGLLVTRPELRRTLTPVLAGWANTLREDGSLFLDQVRPLEDGRRFEPGSLPTVLLAGLAAALELLLEAGLPAIHERVTNHARTITTILLQQGWEVLSPGSGHPIAGIVAARHPFLPAEEVARRLHHRQIEVAVRQGLVRFSPHFYAPAGELDALRVILAKL
jgi:selenocysteine lyase/cysteine desulfurase